MIRLLSALSLTAVFMLQAAPAGDSWSRVAALYHQRLQQTGIVGSSLMFVENGEVAHPKEQRFDFDTAITVSNGGLNAPLGDMAKFLGLLINGNDTILKRSSLDEKFTPQIRAGDGEGGSGDDVQAGLSCFVERHGSVELVGHSGDRNGFISHLYVHRPSKSGYIVSFNTDVSSKRDPRHTTRAVDNDLRDAIAREFWSGAGAR